MATTTKSTSFSSSVNLSEGTRNEIIDLLNARLADTLDLKTQVKFAHWNVKGRNFLQIHELFDTVAEHLEAQADLLAERATALGGVANGTLRQAAVASSIPEYALHAVIAEDHLRAVIDRFAKLTNQERVDIYRSDELGDAVTADLFTGIVRDNDKDLWFLEAHLQG